MSRLLPPGAPIVLGVDDSVERRSGRKISAKGCSRDAVHSTKTRHPLFWPDVGRDAPRGLGALESTRVGLAVSHRMVLACIERRVTMVSRRRWEAALYHWPGPPSAGKQRLESFFDTDLQATPVQISP